MAAEFVDYYDLLMLDPHADGEAIREALDTAQARVNQQRLFPDKAIWVGSMDELLARARETLTDPIRRGRYDAEREQHYEALRDQRIGLDDVLSIDPPAPYEFHADDPDPAYTVPGLAHKFDADLQQTGGKRAIEDLRQGTVDAVLRYVGYGRPNQKRYDALADAIKQLRERLAEQHSLQMLESVIDLCDSSFLAPEPQVNDLRPGDFDLEPITLRPDRDGKASLHLRNGGPRGCLFGALWVGDDWARISSPEPASVTVNERTVPAAWFELVEPAASDVTLTFHTGALMHLSRPQTHHLRLALQTQPGTSHERTWHFSLPVQITTIPPKAVFDPPVVALPTVKRGEQARAVVTLLNRGEDPLKAELRSTSDASVGVAPAILPDAGSIEVTVDTRDVRQGGNYEKTLIYRALGDNPEVALKVKGEVYPTVLQHMLRQQPLRERATFALFAALLPLALAPFLLTALGDSAGWLLSSLAALVVGAAGIGVAYWIALRIVEHIRASGEVEVTKDRVPWRKLLGIVGGVSAVLTLIIAALPLATSDKFADVFWLLTLQAFTFGLFAAEQVSLYDVKRRPAHKSIVDGLSTDAHTIVKGILVFAALVLGITLVVQFVNGTAGPFLTALEVLLALAAVSL